MTRGVGKAQNMNREQRRKAKRQGQSILAERIAALELERAKLAGYEAVAEVNMVKAQNKIARAERRQGE